MSRFDELNDRVTQAVEEITAEINKRPRGTLGQYSRSLTARVTAIFTGLNRDVQTWAERNIPLEYNDAINEAAGRTRRAYEAAGQEAPNMTRQTFYDYTARQNAQENMSRHLADAIESSRRYMVSEIQQAAQTATEEAIVMGQETRIMRQSLVQDLQIRGIESVTYSNGRRVSLDNYARMVSRTTEHEIRNQANINLNARINNDLVIVSEHFGSCPICVPYEGRVYSVSGMDGRFPYLYDTPYSEAYQNFHPNCRHVVTAYIEELQGAEEVKEIQEYSNRSYNIGGEGWTQEQTERANKSLEAYRNDQEQKRRLAADRKQFAKMREILGDEAPKSFSGFRRMKLNNTEHWQELRKEYRQRTAG